MGNLDLKYYLAVFWRRFPYFLLVTALISAIGLALAAILPPVYRSTATLLVEMPQIPDDLAQSTVPVSPIEQIQIIEQRLTTRATLLDLASRFGVHADHADMSTDDIVEDMRARVSFDHPAAAAQRPAHRRRHHRLRLVRCAAAGHGRQGHQRADDPDAAGERPVAHRTRHGHAAVLRAAGDPAGGRARPQRVRRSRSSSGRTRTRCPTASTTAATSRP